MFDTMSFLGLKMYKEPIQTNQISISNIVVRAAQSLKLNEKRLISCALAQIDKFTHAALLENADAGLLVKVSASTYANLFNIKDDSYCQLKEAGELLFERHIRYTILGENNSKKLVKLRWVDKAVYAPGSGFIEVRFTPELKLHLLSLKENFTNYSLENTADLNSIYALRLYEILKSWQSTGKYIVSLDEFNAVLETPPSISAAFKDLRVRVIQPALAAINARTDLVVNCNYKKTGKKVTSLIFNISSNIKKPIKDKVTITDDQKIIISKGVNIGFDSKFTLILIKKYSLDQINEAFHKYENISCKSEIKIPESYLIKIINSLPNFVVESASVKEVPIKINKPDEDKFNKEFLKNYFLSLSESEKNSIADAVIKKGGPLLLESSIKKLKTGIFSGIELLMCVQILQTKFLSSDSAN